jgi:CheY-like chemotaxis protein
MAIDATAWYAVILLAVGAVFWVWRSGTRQVDALRDLARKLARIGSRVLAATSRREIYDVLEQDLTSALGPVWWRLFVYERARRTLESGTEVVQIHAPASGDPAAIALAFRHRVPSVMRAPRSAETTHILPCGLGEEAHGVLVLRGTALAETDSATLTYLANQIGAALANLEHAAGRDLDARAEKRQAVSEVLTRVIGEIEQQQAGLPELADRLRAMMREEDRAIAAANAPTNAGAIRTILLLEPDATQRRAFLAALGDRGLRALPASTVDEAADRLERITFDLVLCSARLAEGGWLDVSNRLGRRSRLVWLADSQTLRWVDGSGMAVLLGADELDTVVST